MRYLVLSAILLCSSLANADFSVSRYGDNLKISFDRVEMRPVILDVVCRLLFSIPQVRMNLCDIRAGAPNRLDNALFFKGFFRVLPELSEEDIASEIRKMLLEDAAFCVEQSASRLIPVTTSGI